MKFNRDKLIALTGTVILHVLVLFILLLFGMEHIRSNEEEGLFVNFGTVDEAQGLFEPEGVESATEPTAPEPSTPQTAEETLITQDTEASIALMEKKKAENLAKQKAAEEQRKLEEARKLKAEQERKAAEIRNQTASVFSRSGSQSGDQGNSTGSGNQGSTTGVPETGNTTGGGMGYGSFSLSGRNIRGSLPRPNYAVQAEGTVVVQIIVNPSGNVVLANISLQGTNTENIQLREAALSAAKQARFNAISDNQNQSGTITYRYLLK